MGCLGQILEMDRGGELGIAPQNAVLPIRVLKIDPEVPLVNALLYLGAGIVTDLFDGNSAIHEDHPQSNYDLVGSFTMEHMELV